MLRTMLLAPLRDRVAAGAAVLALLLTASPVAAKTDFPISGGSGDKGFQDRCPANEYVTGLAGRSGTWVDQIQIICSPILANGKHGTSYYGPLRGGPGGAAQEFSCASDSFGSGVVLYWDDKDSRVVQVDLLCTSTQGNRQTTVTLGGGYVEGTLKLHDREPCPNDELATGFAGRYGKDVNALGLFCDARITASAPAPVRVPVNQGDPIRTTGKVASPTGAAALCPSGFVWREASPTDHVCVTPIVRTTTAAQNRDAASHLSATDHTYGPNTCARGYVWREAYVGDVVCVSPADRKAAADQNSSAPH